MIVKLKTLCAAAVMLALSPLAHATLLTGTMTADNLYTVYISTDDTIAGTAFGSNSHWPSNHTYSTNLTAASSYYLHVFAQDTGGPQMFIGEFNLDDALYAFANGTQTLLTNDTDWQGNSTGFGDAYTGIADLGADGTGPWGWRSGIDDNARYIWTSSLSNCAPYNNDCAYFSTRIDYLGGGTPSVPEPATGALFAIAFASFALARRRKAAV